MGRAERRREQLNPPPELGQQLRGETEPVSKSKWVLDRRGGASPTEGTPGQRCKEHHRVFQERLVPLGASTQRLPGQRDVLHPRKS